jgi:hypothetical protein
MDQKNAVEIKQSIVHKISQYSDVATAVTKTSGITKTRRLREYLV